MILRKNWAANSIRGHIIAGAASNQAGRAKFYVGAPDCSSLVARDDLADGCIEVDCVTIPQILEKAGWDGIDVMKVDIEGGEIALFKDSSQWAGKVGVIVAELRESKAADSQVLYYGLSERFNLSRGDRLIVPVAMAPTRPPASKPKYQRRPSGVAWR